jgi:hypothetical protein
VETIHISKYQYLNITMAKKSSNKIIKEMDELMTNEKEWTPKPDDKSWKKTDDGYYLYKDPKKVEYIINDDMINKMKKYIELFNELETLGVKQPKDAPENKGEDTIHKIFMVYKDGSSKYSVNMTTASILEAIKINVRRQLLSLPNNLEIFADGLNGVKVKLIACTKGIDIGKRKLIKEVRAKFEASAKSTEKLVDDKNENTILKNYNLVASILKADEEANKYTIEKLQSYIFELYNKKTQQSFVGVSYKPVIKTDKVKLLVQSRQSSEKLKGIPNVDFELNILEEYQGLTELHCNFRTNHYIIQKDSISNGYNEYYYMMDLNDVTEVSKTNKGMEEIKKRLFVQIQRELFQRSFEDKTNYDDLNGYIYQIYNKNEKKYFISKIVRQDDKIRILKDVVSHFYTSVLQDKNTFSKLTNAMKGEPYYNFDIQIIKQKTKKSRFDIDEWVKKLTEKYDSVKNGYNIDTSEMAKKMYYGKTIKVKGKK